MRIISVPIEKYEERYTEQWSRWFPNAFKSLGTNYVEILGTPLTSTITEGSVLDVYGTNAYKASQLQKIMQALSEGSLGADTDVFFFHDLWFPGLEMLQYVRNVTGKKFKIAGIFHAGTWDKNDFTYLSGMRPWGRKLEHAWLEFVDLALLGSEFHKELILASNKSAKTKLVVTGLPFDVQEVSKQRTKENIVVFPHRLNKEKCPHLFDRLAKELGPKHPDWKFVKTKDVTKNKAEYYELLAKSKIAVSFAKQETFGYAMLEAVANGAVPIVPDALSYKTMPLYEGFRFGSYEEAKKLVEVCMGSVAQSSYMKFYEGAKSFAPRIIIEKMVKEMAQLAQL